MPEPNAESQAQLLHAYLFGVDGRGQRLDEAQALAWLKGGDRSAGFIWLHFSSAHAIGHDWLQSIEAPAMFREVLRDGRRSSRLTHAHAGLLAVLNDVAYDVVERSEPEVATLWLSVRQHRLLSAWSAPLRSVQALTGRIDAGESFANPLTIVIRLLLQQSALLVDILRAAAESANRIEAALRTRRLPLRATLGGTRRDLVRLQRLLAPEPASLLRLANRPPRWAREDDVDALHVASEDFSVILRDMSGLQERIRLLEDEIVARVAERSNRSLFVLTSATVIALPPTLVAALFGMNVGGLPFRADAHGFWWTLAIAALTTAAAGWLIAHLLADR